MAAAEMASSGSAAACASAGGMESLPPEAAAEEGQPDFGASEGLPSRASPLSQRQAAELAGRLGVVRAGLSAVRASLHDAARRQHGAAYPPLDSEFGQNHRPTPPFGSSTGREPYGKPSPAPGPGAYDPRKPPGSTSRAAPFPRGARRISDVWGPPSAESPGVVYTPVLASARTRSGSFGRAERFRRRAANQPGPGAYTPRFRSLSTFR